MRTWLMIAIVGLAGWFGPSVAEAQSGKGARHVRDEVGLFSANAEAKANADIASIKQKHNMDLVIEAVKAPKRPENVAKEDKAAVDKFFDEWAEERFKHEKISGVYVVIVPEAFKIRVLLGPDTQRLGFFTENDREALLSVIQEKMKAGDKDGALTAATTLVTDRVKFNHPVTSNPQAGRNVPPAGNVQAPPGGNRVEASPIITWVLIGIGVLLVFWIVSAIVRGFASMGRGGYGGGYGPGYGGGGGGGGGGGFMSGMLGGLFGAAAGMWAYNHFLGGGTPSAWGGQGSSGGNYGGGDAVAGPNDVGAGNPSISGGDYDNGKEPAGGDWGGGGDAGGGDAGGGGGGDWGGGGGDAGGGGGDWGGGGGGGDWGGGGGDAGGGGGDW